VDNLDELEDNQPQKKNHLTLNQKQ
jgi:hypothetical protein